ncbi:MAG: Rieske (2Fe-2S) protein [Chloroflexi bacterium]|nr:Rieske (2Fe-2S) protein [Chloroflexota bacterium]
MNDPQQTDADGFFTVAPSEAAKPGRIKRIEVASEPVILTRLEGELCAFSAVCPHSLGDLSGGTIYKGEIDCPVHGWRFDIRSGEAVWPEKEAYRLTRHDVKEEGGLIKVKLKRRPGFRPKLD